MQHPVRRPLAYLIVGAFALGALAAAPPAAAAQGSPLFLSEVIEGSSNNKAVEVYNATDSAVDLSGYRIEVFFNGGSSSTAFPLSGSLASHDVFVFASATANAAILAQADLTTTTGLFNGDDAIALTKDGQILDVFGQIGFDPGSFWGSGKDITQDRTLQREPDSCGDMNGADAFVPTTGWDVFPQDTVTGLGSHTSNCTGVIVVPDPDPVADCAADTVAIGAVQGSGGASPVAGQNVLIEGTVVADFQHTDLDGFYLQDAGDGSASTSDGVFVYQQDPDNTPGNGDGIIDVHVGDVVNVAGKVSEYQGLTEVTAADTEVCATDATVPAPLVLSLPMSDEAREAVEGMYVTFPDPLTIGEFFEFGRFNTVTVAPTRQLTPTAVVEPGAPAQAALAANLAAQLIVDDARVRQNPDPLLHPNGEPFTLDNLFRGGDVLTGVTGIMDQRVRTGVASEFSYGIDLTEPTGYEVHNPRTGAPEVGGDLKVSSFNVLNYFTTLNSRGANTADELARQQAKIVSALAQIDADVFGLIEIENNGDAEHPAVETLTNALNAAIGGEPVYSYIDTNQKIGTDVITTAFVYKKTTVAPVGDFKLLTSAVDPRFIDTLNRPALAQTFQAIEGGEPVTVVVNHLKSKGSACAGDPDTGDGSGNCNITRTNAAKALVDWIAKDPTKQGTADRTLIIGDLNSYDKEDPIDVFTGAGYTDLLLKYQGEDAYSYVFDGMTGYLDHALAGTGLVADVTGASTWSINADEAQVLDYNTEFKPANQVTGLFAPDPYRSSDHDPVLVGIDLDTTPPTLALTATPESLFPPNNKQRTITIEVDAADDFGDVTVELVSAEASGSKKAAVTTVDDTTFDVVAAKGAEYVFTYKATDAAGNSTTESITVVVVP